MIIYQKRIYREDLQANPNVIYVFGDNVQREGLGGQAGECRGEPNAHGIATLWAPGVPFEDKDYRRATEIFVHDVDALVDRMKTRKPDGTYEFPDMWQYKAIVFPYDGIGTGLALLPEEAPACYDFLCGYLELKLGIKNGRPTRQKQL